VELLPGEQVFPELPASPFGKETLAEYDPDKNRYDR
jgi:hypothetical protein